MSDSTIVTGLVATTPRHLVTSEGLALTSFRLASSERHFDRATSRWVDGDTNWFTVNTFSQLATNTNKSIHKGDRVVVSGKMRIRDWENTDRSGTVVEIVADVLGHDLNYCTASAERVPTSEVAA